MKLLTFIFVFIALSNSSSSDDKSDDFEESMNLWPTEELFQSSEETLKSEIHEDIGWFYEKIYTKDGKLLTNLTDYLLFNNGGGTNADYFVSLDTSGTKGIGLLLQTSSSFLHSCGASVEGEKARYVLLPKHYSSDGREHEVRCFQVKKCKREMVLSKTGLVMDQPGRTTDVEFNCIENFDSQLSLSIEKDLKLVSDQLESWSNHEQSLQKSAQTKLPSASVSPPVELGEKEGVNFTSFLDHLN